MRPLLAIAGLLCATTLTVAQVSTPQVIKVQGFLNQSGSPANGTFTMGFTLYDSQFPGGSVVATASPQSVAVSNGLYEVDLPFPSSAFSGSSRYLEITVNGETLTPRMQIVSTPFAYQADKLDGFEGSDFVKKAGDTITGNLQVAGTIWSTSGGFRFPDGSVQTTASTAGNTLDQAYNQGGPGAGRTINTTAGAVNIAGPGGLTVTGKIGVGTNNPIKEIEIIGNSNPALRVASTGRYGTSSAALSLVSQGDDGWHIGTGDDLYGGHGGLGFRTFSAVTRMVISNAGNVGIGTASPSNRLVVEGGNLQLNNNGDGNLMRPDGSGVAFQVKNGGTTRSFGQLEIRNGLGNVTNAIVTDGGNVGIGTTSPGARLDVAGTVKAQVVQITGGDVAEPFAISGSEIVPPGSTMVIDDANPGQLMLSNQPYDRRVAGVVSGAGGINAGVKLYQQGASDSTRDVALSGRVYTLAVASNGAITPGDLLTTSEVPGHVMKVTDYQRAQGAVVGKAMSRLEEGQGLVLVLVNLQ